MFNDDFYFHLPYWIHILCFTNFSNCIRNETNEVVPAERRSFDKFISLNSKLMHTTQNE